MVSAAVVFLLTISSVCGEAAARKLEYVTVVSSQSLPYRPTPREQLATRMGMQEQFGLGQFLRKRYKGFLNDFYDRHEIYIRSTDQDRTLMSAEANLAGLYPPTGHQVFKENLMWQPIPVHTVSQSEERLLSFPLGDCPRYEQLMNETKRTEEFINVTNTYQDIIELVKKKTGLNEINVESVWSVYDTLFCESRHNMSAPDWVTPDVMEKLSVLNDFSIQPPFASCQIFELYRNNDSSVSVSMFYRNDSTVEPYPLQLPGCSLDCPLDEFMRIT
ncbi:hypothetical protein FQN60_003666, partial [Etheostoma spectabile]